MKANHFWSLTKVKVLANLKSEASRNYLNYVWWFLEPALQLLVFYIVFGVLLNNHINDFVIFLACGIVPWLWLNRTVTNSMSSIINGYGLMLYISFPKILLPLVVVLQDSVKQLAVFVVLLSLLVLYNKISVYWLLLPIVVGLQFLLVAASGFFVSAIVPFLPDLRYVLHAFLQLVMFCSGIFYDYHRIPAEYQIFYFLNPVASIIESYRDILIYAQFPSTVRFLSVLLITTILMSLSFLMFKKFDSIYPRVVTSYQ